MTTVHKAVGKQESKFQNQIFFEDFNWQNFNVGDVVWLEDYRGEIEKIAGIFAGYKNETDPIVRLTTNRDGLILARNSGLPGSPIETNILNYSSHWSKRYL